MKKTRYETLKSYIGLNIDMFDIDFDMTAEVVDQLSLKCVGFNLVGKLFVTNDNDILFVDNNDVIVAIVYQHGFIYSVDMEDEIYTISVLKDIQNKYNKIISSARMWLDTDFNELSLDDDIEDIDEDDYNWEVI